MLSENDSITPFFRNSVDEVGGKGGEVANLVERRIQLFRNVVREVGGKGGEGKVESERLFKRLIRTPTSVTFVTRTFVGRRLAEPFSYHYSRPGSLVNPGSTTSRRRTKEDQHHRWFFNAFFSNLISVSSMLGRCSVQTPYTISGRSSVMEL